MAISSGDRNGQEPSEGNPNPSPLVDGDAASPTVDPAEDDDLEELVEDDSNNDNGTDVEPAKPKVTFSADTTAPKARINPYPFGHINTPKKPSKAAIFSGGSIPSFGDASSAVGKRPFDGKPFDKVAEGEVDDAQTPERNFLGISPATRPTPPVPTSGKADGDKDNNNNSAVPFSFGAQPADKDDGKTLQFSFGNESSISAAKKPAFSFGTVPPATSTPSALKPVAYGAASGVGASKGFGAGTAAPATTAGFFGASTSAAKSLSFGTNTSPKIAAFGTSATSQPATPAGFGNLVTKSAGFGTTGFGKPSAFGGASFSFAQPSSGGGIFGDVKKKNAPDNNNKSVGFGSKADGDGTKPWKSSFGSSETAPSKPTTDAPRPFVTSSPFGSATPPSFGTGTSLQLGKPASGGFGAASTTPALGAAPATAKFGASSPAFGGITPFGTVSPKVSAFGSVTMKTPSEKSTPMPEMDGEKKSPYPFGSSPKYAESSSTFSQNPAGKLFTGEIPKFGSFSSPGNSGKKKKRVSTPLFGLGSSAAQTAPVKFSKRASFQTSLSPSAAVFVPGASLFNPRREDGKDDVKENQNRSSNAISDSPAEKAQAPTGEATVEKSAGGLGPKSILEMKMVDVTPKKEEDSMEVSKPPNVQALAGSKPTMSASDSMEGVIPKAPSREWSHVFEGVNLMIVMPSVPGLKRTGVVKKKSAYKLEIFKDERGLRIEVVCTESIDDASHKAGDVFISWELGAAKMKVNRIKNRTTHAAMTRLGSAIPEEITEHNPAKVFVVFKQGDECLKFLGICSNPHLQMRQTAQAAVPEAKQNILSIVPKKEESSEEKESSIPPTQSPPPSQETPSASPPLTTPVQSKDEEEEGKTQVEGPGNAQKSSAAALAAKKKLLMQKMKLSKAGKSRGTSLPAVATPSGPVSVAASDDAGTEKKREPPTATAEKAPTVPAPSVAAPAVPSWSAQGTKRSASAALEIDEPKKQKKMVEGTTLAKADVTMSVKSDIEDFKKERAAREDLKKQIDVLTVKLAEMKEDNAKADKVNKSLRLDIREMKAVRKKDAAAVKDVVAAVKKLKRTIRPVKEEKSISIAVSEKLKACNPKSREEFFERLWTFKPSTWIGFAEIGKLDPVQCAMYGWYNCDKNQLRSSEGAEIYMNEDIYLSKRGNEEVKRVRENITGMAHPILSGWRGTKCPDEFAEPNDKEIAEECEWFEANPQDETLVRCKWCGRKSCKSQVKSKKKSLLHYKHCAYLSRK